VKKKIDSDRDVLSFAVRVVWDKCKDEGSACPPSGRLRLDPPEKKKKEGLGAECSNCVCLCDEEIYVLVDLGWRQRPFGAEFETYGAEGGRSASFLSELHHVFHTPEDKPCVVRRAGSLVLRFVTCDASVA
jgi:hypothetical protein